MKREKDLDEFRVTILIFVYLVLKSRHHSHLLTYIQTHDFKQDWYKYNTSSLI